MGHLSISESALSLHLRHDFELVQINFQPFVCVARYRLLWTPSAAVSLRANSATTHQLGWQLATWMSTFGTAITAYTAVHTLRVEKKQDILLKSIT